MNKTTSHTNKAESTGGFQSLPLDPALHEALRAAGYVQPTSIQQQAIPPALAGKDVLGIAQTGTGKTAAFALPILQHLLQQAQAGNTRTMPRAPKALILAPTRELAAQIGKSFTTYGSRTRLRTAVIFGGVAQGPQTRALSLGVDILVATPGRLIDLMEQRHVDLRGVAFLVLDEADHMLDMGFIQPIRRILNAMTKQRQSMMFSATMPATIQHLADAILRHPVKVAVAPAATTVERVEQRLYKVAVADKTALLVHLLRQHEVRRALVFTKTKHGADKVVKKLATAGITANAIHGNKGQSQRTRTLEAFRAGTTPVLIATDIAARGIDVVGITHVVNFDMPLDEETYVHRIGRTARAEATGVAISLCSGEERGLLRNIEKLIRTTLTVHTVPHNLPVLPQITTTMQRGPRQHGRAPARSSHSSHAPRSAHASPRHSSARYGSSSAGASHARTASPYAASPRAAHSSAAPQRAEAPLQLGLGANKRPRPRRGR